MISFQWQKTKKINTDFSITDWLHHVRQIHFERSNEFANSLWVLLAHVLKRPKSWLLAHGEEKIPQGKISILNGMVSRLIAGEPLAYLIGYWSFFGLDFLVDKTVLIPRPETELLVEKAIIWLRMNPNARAIMDFGTGSGCIAISLATIFPDRDFFASDISFSSLEVASKNSMQHSTKNIHLVSCDLMECLNKKFNLICSNPPYIPTKILKSLRVSQYEPWLALNGGENGMNIVSRFLEESTHHLEKKGALLMEIESSNKKQVLNIARNYFPTAEIHIQEDLAGNARLLMIVTH